MTTLDAARAHLDKAREFLEAAELTLDVGLFNAATSSAVSCGINSKDAICLKLTGRSTKAENHKDAVRELKAAGPKAAALAPTLDRLLSVKAKAQYQAVMVARTDAAKAVEWAGRIYEGAADIVAS